LLVRVGTDIHGQHSARAAVQRVWRQQHRGEIALPRHVQQWYTRNQREEFSSCFGRRAADTQQQQNRAERHWIPSSKVSVGSHPQSVMIEYSGCFFVSTFLVRI